MIFETLIPVGMMTLYLLSGILIKKLFCVQETLVSKLKFIVFEVMLPIAMFESAYHTDINKPMNYSLMIFGLLFIMLILIFGKYLVDCHKEFEYSQKGVVLQALFHTNFIIFGLPILNSLYPHSSGQAIVILAVFSVIVSLLGVIVLMQYQEHKSMVQLIQKVLLSPLVISSFLGLLFCYMDLSLPNVLDGGVTLISKYTSPLSLVLLGIGFSFHSAKGSFNKIVNIVILKLLILPIVIITIAIIVGFRGVDLIVVFLLFSTPVAVASYGLVNICGGDVKLANQLIIITTLASIPSMSFIIGILTYLRMI